MSVVILVAFFVCANFASAEDIYWDNAAGGDWKNATNWDPFNIPDNLTEDVKVTLPGSYTINLDADIVAGSLTLLNPNATIDISATATTDRSLILSGDTLINGTINLTSNFDGNESIFQRDGIVTNNGTFNALGTGSGLDDRRLSVDTFNNNANGLINVETRLRLGQSGSIVNNSGTIQLAPGADLYIYPSAIFNQNSGLLDNQGFFRAYDFNFNGGTLTGNPISLLGTLNIAPGNTSAGAFIFDGNGSFSGNPASAQSLSIVATSSTVTVVSTTEDFVNDGTINLRSDHDGSEAVLLRHGTVTNNGTLNSDGSSVGLHSHQVNVNTFDNSTTGLFNVESNLWFNQINSVFNNSGTFHVAANGYVRMDPSVDFNQNSGTLDNQGILQARDFDFNGGTLFGNPILISGGSLDIATGNTNPGEFVFQGSNYFSGDLASDQTLNIETLSSSDSVLTVNEDFTNDGTINLRSDHGGEEAILKRIGTVTNNGTINADGSSTGIYARQFIIDTFENTPTGTVNILSGGMWLDQDDSVFNNSGAVHVAVDASLYMHPSVIFNQNSGTLDNQGFIWAQNLNFNGGSTSGNPIHLIGGTLNIAPGNTNPGSFLFQGQNGNHFSGDLAPTQTLKIEATNVHSGEVTAADDFTNQGTIVLRSDHDGEDAILDRDGTITNNGSLEFRGDATADRIVAASLVNVGTVDAFSHSNIGRTGASHVNTGEIRVNGPAAELVFSGDSFLNDTGGVIKGVGTVGFASSLPATSRGVIAPGHSLSGELTLDGDLILLSGSTLEIQLGGTSQGTSYDYLNSLDFLGLNGSLRVTLINGFESNITSDDVFTIVSANVMIGQFEGVPDGGTVDSADGQWSFDVSYVGHTVVLSNATMNDFLLGDVNQDGSVDLLDVAPFVTLVADGTFQVEGDINQDGSVDLLDVTPFVELLAGG